MIIRILFLALGSLLAFAPVCAQPGSSKTQEAVRRYQEGDLMAARTSILEALQSPIEQTDPFTWYVKGFLFKEIYKQIDKGDPRSESREIAVQAILQSMDLDASGRQAEDNQKALSFLAISYYNDAVMLTRNLGPGSLDEPERYYNRYKELNSVVNPEKDYRLQDAEFYKNMARACRIIYDRAPLENLVYFDLIVRYYQQALEAVPTDFQANYNTAVSYYNLGVHKIRQIDHNTEIFELIAIQEDCVELFKKALPFMLSAHELEPEHEKTLKGLMAIYRSLSDNTEAQAYQNQLEALIQQGKIKE